MTVTRRLLLQVTLGTGLVLAVVTAVTYLRVYAALEERELQTVRTYVKERAQREEERFLRVQANMLLVRGQYLKRLMAPSPPGFLERWDFWYCLYPDGAWRSREAFKDARLYASMWAHRDWRDTPEARREVLIAQELCDEMLPGWVDAFPSYYFQFHGPLNIGVDTAIPDWAWGMPAESRRGACPSCRCRWIWKSFAAPSATNCVRPPATSALFNSTPAAGWTARAATRQC